MAVASIETHVANPGKKRGRKMAKAKNRGKLSAAQIAAGFGGKRRQSAHRAAKKRLRAEAQKHRARTAPNKSRVKAAKNAAKHRNTGALYALVNPAKRGHKKMAKTKKHSAAKKGHSSAGHKKQKNRARKHNAGAMGRPQDWLALGAGAVVGGLGATSLPQMVLGASNNGAVGYLGMAAATGILATVAHFVFKRNVMLTSGVIAGGAGALIKRVIGDYTPLGQYLNANAGASGMGDYLTNWAFTTPQIIGGPGNTQLGAAGTIPVSVAGAGSMARPLLNV